MKKPLLALSLLLTLSPTAQAMSPYEATLEADYQNLKQAYAHKALIHKFYTAFAQHDAATMRSCYHPDAKFYDPVFQSLTAKETRAMWSMLLARIDTPENLVIKHKNVDANPLTGDADWDAWYPFSQTGNRVHNQIHAQFEFKDGLIYRHIDDFDFHTWSSMALGPVGALLGGTDFLQNQVRKQARKSLDEYLKAHPNI